MSLLERGAAASRSDAGPAPPSRRLRRGWDAAVMVVAVLIVLPVALVAVGVLTPSTDVWAFLWRTELPSMLGTTLALLVAVVCCTLLLGTGLAWLVGRYRFPGQRWFSWLLVLPLAVPAYVLGFVYLGLLDHPGPVQSAMRGWFGDDVWFPEVRSFPMAVLVLSLASYPYVYLLARAAVSEQTAATYEAARVLGQGPVQAAVRVVLPLARPSLAAGAALVAMETLTDFATIQYFNVRTVSVAVYQVWNGMYDRVAATEVASLVLLFAVAVLAFERAARGGSRFSQQGGSRGVEPVQLTGRRAWAATAVCATVVGLGFAGPVLQLCIWAFTAATRDDGYSVGPSYAGYLVNSVLIAALVAVLCAGIAVLLASATRLGEGGTGRARRLAGLTTVGYAVPGPVVAIGVLAILAAADSALDALGSSLGGLLVTGTVAGLVYAYAVRFLALAYNSVDASLDKVSPSLTSAALTLGSLPADVVRRIHLPLMRSGVGVALVLVAVEALKELPIVLMLRPFGFETLAIWVYQLASESRWELAALPALTIVGVAVLPVALLLRSTLSKPYAGGWR
ncbi:MAG: Ferric iron ABC transporter, permease protein [uncultured Nocardioidaceae bacterium]|uniref:Ferric iron ABC transporter, permease protein n=1 Tax=uncultured Nocardioidaceae bacterium TaxID=253824 RepID=A0A6J4M3A7_9ACTN|nr:MAG: Ferric iron ABC transporter, permease protein [uncultured Nocardioidaceae bacterium]